MRPFARSLSIFGVGLVLLSGALVAAYELRGGARRTAAADNSAPSIGGPFTLVDSAGSAVTDKTYRGKWMLIYFGYTSCPDVCPTTLAQIAAALDKLGSLSAKVQPLFISVDPARDTPKMMGDYTRAFDPRIIGLTGTVQQIAAVAREFGVYYAPQTPANGKSDYSVDHSSYIYVVDPAGNFATALGGGISGDAIAARLKQLLGSKSS